MMKKIAISWMPKIWLQKRSEMAAEILLGAQMLVDVLSQELNLVLSFGISGRAVQWQV